MTQGAFKTQLLRTLFVVVALTQMPWILGAPSTGLDGSWQTVISHAFANGWQFGKDLVFTLGPYGFLYTRQLHPETDHLTLAFSWLHALALAGSLAYFVRGRHLLATCILFLTLLAATHTPDAAFALVPLMLLLCYAAGARFLVAALLILTALIGLAKFTFALLGLAMIVLIEAHRFSRGRRMPYYLLAYAVLSVLFFVLAGQDPANFMAYISTSLYVTAGYSEAMQLTGPLSELSSFLVLAACFIGLALYHEARRAHVRCAGSDRGRLLLPVGLCVYTFLAFKAGFVRHDGYHALIAWAALSTAAAAYSIFILPETSSALLRTALIGLCMVSVTLTMIRLGQLQQPVTLSARFAEAMRERGVAAASVLRGDYADRQAARYAAARDSIRTTNPLPNLDGTVDTYPWDQAALLAHGLQYHPRPVFQSYLAYNSKLIELNRDHIRSGRSAAFLLFDVKTIDGRMPSLDDGQLWPEMIARYDPQGTADRYLVLRKRRTLRRVELAPVSRVSTTWFVPVQVPKDAAPVWVSLELRKTAFGKLVDLLYRLPPIMIDVELDDGATRAFRLVPEMARAGFLLSPLIESPERFSRLFDSAASSSTSGRVSQFEVRTEPPFQWVYDGTIEVRFSTLCVEPCRTRTSAAEHVRRYSRNP